MGQDHPREPQQPGEIIGEDSIIVASNRQPYCWQRNDAGQWQCVLTTGGLVSALDPIMREHRGLWVAWDPVPQGERGCPLPSPRVSDRPYPLLQIPLRKNEVECYYDGFSNQALWPLSHGLLQHCNFDPLHWADYRKVNQRFAVAIARHGAHARFVWIQDFHLMLVPRLLRQKCDSPIAYFHHVPFPPPDIFQVLPWRRQVLDGVLGADMIAFHAASYASNFLECCRRLLNCNVNGDGSGVRYRNRTIKVAVHPIGIDVDCFQSLSRNPSVAARSSVIRHSFSTCRLVLSVDRLDYTKGLLERIEAIDHFFARYPERRGKVTFLQIAVPSRTRVSQYQQLKRRVDEAVGHLCGCYGTSTWQPIRYVCAAIDRPELVAHYLAADVALITPVRDGMNLIALEYCQSRVAEDGILILSEMAGAAEYLGDSALLVNPYDREAVAERIEQALRMQPSEQKRRMRALRGKIREIDVSVWFDANVVDVLGSNRPRAAISSARPAVAASSRA